MRTLRHLSFLILSAFMIAAFASCEMEQTANDRERAAVNGQQERFLRAQPTPSFEWSLERQLMIQLYQARSTRTTTYSYVINTYNGSLLMSCQSLGFPIPATSQLTNPSTVVTSGQGITTIGQAEPNGLYAPSSTDATWVMCLGADGGVEPRYVENRVITTVRPMHMVDGQLVPIEGQAATLTLRTER